MTGHGGPGREDDRTVVLSELLELGVEPGVIKVRIDHPRLEVVDHDGGGNAPEGSEGVFEAPDEVLGRLPRGGFGVALAGMAQDSAKQMRATPLALHEDPSSLPEVDLKLVSRGALHASEGDLSRLLKAADEAFDRVIGTGEPVFDHQILIDPLGGKPGLKPPLDDLLKRSALAGPSRLGPEGQNGWFWTDRCFGAGGRNGWFWILGIRRPDGRNGRFCRVGSQTQVASDGLTVEAELTGDLACGPALGRQRDDGMLQAHVELVHRAGLRLPPHPTQHPPQSGWFSFAHPWLVLTAR